MQMGWSNTEDLVCIGDRGDVYVYDMFGSYKRQFSLGLVSKALLSMFGSYFIQFDRMHVLLKSRYKALFWEPDMGINVN